MRYILVILLVLFASYGDIFLYRIGIVPVTPSNFLVPLFIVLSFLKYPLKEYVDILKTPGFKFLLLIFILSIVFAPSSKAETSVIIPIIVLKLMSVILYVFAVHFFRTENKKIIVTFLLISFILLAGSIWYDFFIGLPNYSAKLAQNLRKGGFGENPNQAASGVKFLALGILLFVGNKKKLRYIVIAMLVGTVFLTFSRSGLVSTIMILILGTMNDWKPTFQLTPIGQFKSIVQLFFLFTIIYLSLLSLSDVIKKEFPAFGRGAMGERMDLVLGKSDKVVFEKGDRSTHSRTGLFKRYLNVFFDNPFGVGTGYSSDKSLNRLKTHNYYLYLAVDYGIIGLLVYVIYLINNLLIAFRINQYYYFIFMLLLILEGLISHSIFIERSIIICLAFFDSQLFNKQVVSSKIT